MIYGGNAASTVISTLVQLLFDTECFRAITALAAYSRSGLVRTPSAGRSKFLGARSPPTAENSVSVSQFYQYRDMVTTATIIHVLHALTDNAHPNF